VDFGQLLTGAMNDITQTGKTAEKQMIAHANGRAELVDVVTGSGLGADQPRDRHWRSATR
jgi:flagellar hook-basal body complex protein FliE